MSAMKILVVDDERAVRESLRRALELEGYDVDLAGDLVELTRTEFSLLELFLLNPRQVLTRSVIFERVWGYDFGFASNSLDVYIGYLRRKTEAGGQDELGRLASSFNTMLGALEESTRAERQLVADASHELRTPLTSLRTNIEVLASERSLPPDERERLLKDVVEQLGEMTTLVAELIELARGEREPAQPEEVRLDLVAADAVDRTRRNRPGVTFTTDLQESVVHGVPATIERAVANLLDNAAKWSPPGGEVEVAVRDGEVTVRDHGPGIDEEDLPYVFDRFYRASSARR